MVWTSRILWLPTPTYHGECLLAHPSKVLSPNIRRFVGTGSHPMGQPVKSVHVLQTNTYYSDPKPDCLTCCHEYECPNWNDVSPRAMLARWLRRGVFVSFEWRLLGLFVVWSGSRFAGAGFWSCFLVSGCNFRAMICWLRLLKGALREYIYTECLM